MEPSTPTPPARDSRCTGIRAGVRFWVYVDEPEEAQEVAGVDRLRGNLGSGLFRGKPAPDQHIRAQVGSVRPDDRAAVDPGLLEQGPILEDRHEHRTDEKGCNVALDHRSIGEREAELRARQDLDVDDP